MQTLLIGGQACVLFRGAELSRNTDLIEMQEHHSRQIREVLKKSERVTLLEVSFPDLVADPGPVIAKLADFLPGRFTPGLAVAACVKPKLFRNRR